MSDHEREGAHAALRGAGVEADPRRVVRLLGAAALAASVAGIAALTAAGFTKNSQLDELHQHGRPLRATVLACRSLLGGSGSNGVGYSCVGTYWLGGHRYVVTLPGSERRSPGSSVRVVVAATDPGLLDAPAMLEHEHASWRVYRLPGLMTLVLLVCVVTVARRTRRAPRARPS